MTTPKKGKPQPKRAKDAAPPTKRSLPSETRRLRELIELQECEARLMAYEIHDGLAQQLSAALMKLQAFAQLRKTRQQEGEAALESGMQLLRDALAESRRLIEGLSPPILDEFGLVAALEHLVLETQHRWPLQIELRHDVRFSRLSPALEHALFRIAQESLANIRRHSKSPTLEIDLTQPGERVRLEVRDQGVGFDPKKMKKDRYGLRGIRERAKLLGGRAEIQSAPGKGTRVIVELPLALPDETD